MDLRKPLARLFSLAGVLSLPLPSIEPPTKAFGQYATEDDIAPTRRHRWGSTYHRKTPRTPADFAVLEAAKARRARRGRLRELNHLRHITGRADARAFIEMRTETWHRYHRFVEA